MEQRTVSFGLRGTFGLGFSVCLLGIGLESWGAEWIVGLTRIAEILAEAEVLAEAGQW